MHSQDGEKEDEVDDSMFPNRMNITISSLGGYIRNHIEYRKASGKVKIDPILTSEPEVPKDLTNAGKIIRLTSTLHIFLNSRINKPIL